MDVLTDVFVAPDDLIDVHLADAGGPVVVVISGWAGTVGLTVHLSRDRAARLGAELAAALLARDDPAPRSSAAPGPCTGGDFSEHAARTLDLTAVAQDDALLARLGHGGQPDPGDHLGVLLAAWRRHLLAEDRGTKR